MLEKSSQYSLYIDVIKTKQLSSFFKKTRNSSGSFFLNVKIEKGSFFPLPRPKETPLKNIELFKKQFIKI